jgi:integrase/recombinase XerC
VQRCLNPRDRVLALLPFYAGLRIGEAVALDVADVSLSARKGFVVVRSGKGGRYREIPLHPELREQLAIWINDERPSWPASDANPALLLNARGGRLGVRGASDVLTRLAEDAGIDAEDFTSHVLRHTFGTTLVRGGHDLVLVAELMGHRRLETTRGYSLPSAADRERAINSLPTDR